MDPAVERLFERVSAITGISIEVLSGKKGNWSPWGGAGKVGEALAADPYGITKAFVTTAQEDDPSKLPQFLQATYKEMSKHIGLADDAGDMVASSIAGSIIPASLGGKKKKALVKQFKDPRIARNYTQGRIAGLLGHHLDKDKFGPQ